jgi:hypothetical protein
MKKENIYVEITNETERLRAIEILQNAGEEIFEDSKLLMPFKVKMKAVFDENIEAGSNWISLNNVIGLTKITLDKLEALLTPKKSNVFTEVQEWIRENTPELSWVFTQKEEPECFKLLKEHLINDYPKGTEIKISKDKIEIYHS